MICLLLFLLLGPGQSAATCSYPLACLDVGGRSIDVVHDVTEEMDCMVMCAENTSCTFYTWYNVSTTTMANMCLMFSSCYVTDKSCSGCFSGPPDCGTFITTPGTVCLFDLFYYGLIHPVYRVTVPGTRLWFLWPV